MPHKKFLELLQAVEAHRKVVGLPSLPVTDEDVAQALGLDESHAAHSLETENAP